MLVEFSKMLVAWEEKHQHKNGEKGHRFPGACGLEGKMCLRGGFSKGPRFQKMAFCLHVYDVLLLSTERLFF